MKTIMKTTQTKLFFTFIALFAFVFQVNAECNTSTPIEPQLNPGESFTITVNFHAEGNNLRRMVLENKSSYVTNLSAGLADITEFNGSANPEYPDPIEVLDASPYQLGAGDHQLQFTGNISSTTPCGVVLFFRIKFQKRDIFWFTECARTFYIQINSQGNIQMQGDDQTCGISATTLTVAGTSGNEYVWTSSNPTYLLNGNNDWPITTDNASVIIKPTIAGSSSVISVAASGSDICGVANASHSLQSIDASITLSGAPYTCNSTGNSITVKATELEGAIYTWSYKNVNSIGWSPGVSTTSNMFTIPGQNVAATFNVRCGVAYNGCTSKANVLQIKWCVNNNPNIPRACCLKQVPTEKKKSIRRSTSSLDNLQVDAFPNPTNGKLTLSGSSEIQGIVISNMQGKSLTIIDAKNQMVVDLNFGNYPAGIYLLQVNSLSGSKLIKVVKSE